MRIIINHSSMIPIYEQTVDQIKKQINDHILQENDPLPFVRLLSKELRISALTVKKAYDTLDEEGLTKTIHDKMIKKEMVIMGCHRIGLGMNSVVKEAIEMFENEEIGLNACKKIIMACKNGVYWCDGYESDVIAGMDDYCGNYF